MAIITPNTNGTLKSNTAEGQLIELLIYLQKAEKVTNIFDYIQVNLNLNTFTFTGSFSIPVEQEIGSSGEIYITAQEYIANLNFQTGYGGTFNSETSAQYLLELITYLQLKEDIPANNPKSENRISASFDSDRKLFTGNISLEINVNFLSDGKVTISPVEYLLA